ncbi:motility associated factor glycosyltransferase family protein [Paenibacillus albus]|uniref:DUF115 domain-containing protein n=1 Tax=Paenibacillus albus TaxID=2495582 RepID=A0A3Q8X296_9BACL|nr:6-hydroxymethylpterin diphosphokinase MptE-like protein [Paenibacillus albus]AZN38518.1 DUF115 domain-containing protein [Paenibacillus albus]
MIDQTSELELMVEELKLFLPKLTESCHHVSEMFYETVSDHTWGHFSSVLQGMDDVYRLAGFIQCRLEEASEDTELYASIQKFVITMPEKFQTLNQFIDDECYVQAADYLKYELVSLFQELAIGLGESNSVREQQLVVNLAFLEKKYPKVHKVVLEAMQQEDAGHEIIYSKNGFPNLSLYTIDQKKVHLYSDYDPQHEAERWAASLVEKLKDKSNLIFYGLGLGYHLTQILALYRDRRIIIIEPNVQIFLAAMRTVDLQQLFGTAKITDLAVGTDNLRTEYVFYRFFQSGKGDTEVLSIPVYNKLDPHKLANFRETVVKAMYSYVLSMRANIYTSKQWITNMLNNAAVLADTPSLYGMKDKLAHMTAVVVGAGPSLEADIELLRKLKNHAFIIAAGSVIQSLKKYEIEPHLIVCVDGTDTMYELFSRSDKHNIPLLCVSQIEYRIIENRPNVLHAFYNSDLVTGFIIGMNQDDPAFFPNHSGTGLCIQAAAYMGCKEIVLAGQDLSYPNGQIYASGAAHMTNKREEEIRSEARLLVDNVQGSQNRTTVLMHATLRDIENTLDTINGVHFINTSSLGAAIRNTEFVPMEDILVKLEHNEIEPHAINELFHTHLRPYDAERKKLMIDRLAMLQTGLVRMGENLEQLESKLNLLPAMDEVEQGISMEEIEDIWGPMVDDVTFVALLETLMKIELLTLDRNMPELVEETNVSKKAAHFHKTLLPFVEAAQTKLPFLEERVREGIERFQARIQNPIEVFS